MHGKLRYTNIFARMKTCHINARKLRYTRTQIYLATTTTTIIHIHMHRQTSTHTCTHTRTVCTWLHASHQWGARSGSNGRGHRGRWVRLSIIMHVCMHVCTSVSNTYVYIHRTCAYIDIDRLGIDCQFAGYTRASNTHARANSLDTRTHRY